MRCLIILAVVIYLCIAKAQDTMRCGVPNIGALEVRFGDDYKGNFAEFGEFPWVIAVIKKSTKTSTEWSDKEHVSTGTLIHPSVVLTNARTVEKYAPNELKCRAGEFIKTSEDEIYEHQDRDVRKIVKHEHYYRESLHNAVSLVFLEQPFNLKDAPNVAVACVGQGMPEPGTQCYSTGWGNAAHTSKTEKLKKIPIKLLNSETCEKKYKNTRLGMFFKLHDSLFCGTSSNDTCKGDKGAPLICPVHDIITKYVLYGMSAYRIEDAPCTYVKVTAFYRWIGEKISQEGISDTYYTYVPTNYI